MLLTDIRFCTQDHLDQILAADRTSLHPWPERVISLDLVGGAGSLSYLGAFAPMGDRLLGYAVLGEEKGNGLLMNLVVVPEYRRRGIGQQLVVSVAECAVELGFPRLTLRVRYSNHAALRLYRSLGFRSDATRESFYSNGDVAFFMSLKLPLVLKGDESR
ncbi:MAG: GNAT family N-acetyltransferase [Synergistaceae bacterium]|jgi:ribosomal-protein-alanine N-acetyltransferase|nr:GNAT family N-acetyltransferase [Synergistaceae bacterium]